jgi:Flp pilus assembly protein TadG
MAIRIVRSTEGTALVEFALVGGVLIWLLFGVLDMSRMFYACSATSGAAEAGVRYGLLSTSNNSDLTGMQTAAIRDANLTGASATATQVCKCSDGTSISCTGTCSSGSLRLYLKVIVNAPFSSFYPGMPTVIQGQAFMRVK